MGLNLLLALVIDLYWIASVINFFLVASVIDFFLISSVTRRKRQSSLTSPRLYKDVFLIQRRQNCAASGW